MAAKAYLKAIKAILARGWKISVYDGEEWAEKLSTSYKAVKDAIEAVEEAKLVVRKNDPERTRLGSLYVLPYGVGPEESIADWGWDPDNPDGVELDKMLNDIIRSY